jgi:hypothetical protein
MHRLSRLIVALASFSPLASTGCAEEQELLVIRGAYDLDDECVFDDSARLAGDTIDVSSGASFSLGLLVANLQTQNANSNTNIEDDGEIRLDYAEVRLSLPGGTAPAGLDTDFEASIPTDSIPSGEELGILVRVPSSVTTSLQASVTPGDLPTLEMSVVLVGSRTSSAGKLGEVRSQEYTFPFILCNGCVTCPTDCGLPQLSDCVED